MINSTETDIYLMLGTHDSKLTQDKWQGPALGARSGVKKTLHRENKLKK